MDVSTLSVDSTPVAPVAPIIVDTSIASRADWEREREQLYQQLDDKVRNNFYRRKNGIVVNLYRIGRRNQSAESTGGKIKRANDGTRRTYCLY